MGPQVLQGAEVRYEDGYCGHAWERLGVDDERAMPTAGDGRGKGDRGQPGLSRLQRFHIADQLSIWSRSAVDQAASTSSQLLLSSCFVYLVCVYQRRYIRSYRLRGSSAGRADLSATQRLTAVESWLKTHKSLLLGR